MSDERIEEREAHRMLLEAEPADDATAIKVYRAIARNYRRHGVRMGAATSIEALCDRLEAATRKLAASGNYVADSEVFPSRVEFANGRTVRIGGIGGGGPYLLVDRADACRTPNPDRDGAVNARPRDAALDLLEVAEMWLRLMKDDQGFKSAAVALEKTRAAIAKATADA